MCDQSEARKRESDSSNNEQAIDISINLKSRQIKQSNPAGC